MSPFEGGLGHLLSQYGSGFGGEVISKVLELCITGGRGNGEIWVEQFVEKWISVARGD